MSSDSSPEKIMLPSRRGTMSAGSVRKRKQVLSDEEEEPSGLIQFTPDPGLGKRAQKVSAEKVKRGLRLEELKRKRNKSSAKKGLLLESNINSSESLEAGEQNLQEDDNHSSSKWYQINTQSLEKFSQELSSSSVDSEEDPKNLGSQEESQQSFSSVDDDCEEEDDLSDFIDFESNTQDQIAKDELQQLIWKPSREEAHKLIVKRMLISLLDNKPLETESNQLFNKAKDIIETLLQSKKDLVGSSVWGVDFKQMLTQCSVLQDEPLRQTKEAKCEACRKTRIITQLFCFYEESNDKTVKRREFRIGRYCADKALIYHRIHHYCPVELKKSCEEKLGELLAVSGSEESSKESVEKYFSDHQPWLRKVQSY